MPLLKLNEKLAGILGKKQEVKVTGHPVREMAEILAGINDTGWGMYAFRHEILEGKFTDEQKKAYIAAANCCGREEARKLRLNYPKETAEAIARDLGFTIRMKSVPTGGGHVIFAEYEEPDRITVYMDAADRGNEVLKSDGISDVIGNMSVMETLIAHELFHGIEYRIRDEIYTQTERIELWKKPFSNRSRIRCLSEIAAMAFARELLQTKVSPFILDVLLVFSYNSEAASALFEEICDAAGIPIGQNDMDKEDS